ncbi:hypothetical protein DSUL_100182 [Desulfovibrionales bacterium]
MVPTNCTRQPKSCWPLPHAGKLFPLAKHLNKFIRPNLKLLHVETFHGVS